MIRKWRNTFTQEKNEKYSMRQMHQKNFIHRPQGRRDTGRPHEHCTETIASCYGLP